MIYRPAYLCILCWNFAEIKKTRRKNGALSSPNERSEFLSVPAQVYRVFEEEDMRLTRLGDSISSVLRKELGSRITGRTNLMVRQTFENQEEAWRDFVGFGWNSGIGWLSELDFNTSE